MDLLKKQKEFLKEAQAHKGEAPEKADRDKLIMALLVSGVANIRMQKQTVNGVKVQAAFLPPPYLPCAAPLSDLKKVMIKDLVLETHHRGTYVILRAVTPAVRMSAILAVVEDEDDNVVVLQLYHQDNSCCPEHILDDEAVVIVKEPYLKRDADGRVSIRVDHLSDVIFLHNFDERIPEVWRQFPTEHDPCEDEDLQRLVNTWRMRGQHFFSQLKVQFAIDWLA